jgi:hypothetical protein
MTVLNTKAKGKLSLPVSTTPSTYMGSGRKSPDISNFVIRFRCVVSFAFLPLCSGGRSPGTHSMDKRLVGSLSLSRHRGKKVKMSCYTPWRRLGGKEVQLLLIPNLCTRWG